MLVKDATAAQIMDIKKRLADRQEDRRQEKKDAEVIKMVREVKR